MTDKEEKFVIERNLIDYEMLENLLDMEPTYKFKYYDILKMLATVNGIDDKTRNSLINGALNKLSDEEINYLKPLTKYENRWVAPFVVASYNLIDLMRNKVKQVPLKLYSMKSPKYQSQKVWAMIYPYIAEKFTRLFSYEEGSSAQDRLGVCCRAPSIDLDNNEGWKMATELSAFAAEELAENIMKNAKFNNDTFVEGFNIVDKDSNEIICSDMPTSKYLEFVNTLGSKDLPKVEDGAMIVNSLLNTIRSELQQNKTFQ